MHKLLCIPYAGGSASYFRQLQDCVPPTVDVNPVELSGHGERIGQERFRTITAMAADLGDRLVESVKDAEFSVLGYSMGAFVAFELARYLKERYDVAPTALFIAAQRSPSVIPSPPYWHQLEDAELLSKLSTLNSTSVLDKKQMELIMSFMLPTIRCDLEAVELYRAEGVTTKLDIPFHAFVGDKDTVAGHDKMGGWADYTSAAFSMKPVDGGHFFLNENKQVIADHIAACLGIKQHHKVETL